MIESDVELLARWRCGDRAAGDQLFSRYFDPVCRFFRNKVDGPIEDLVQDVFLACLNGRERFRAESSFRTYLFAIARHRLYDLFRARHRGALDFTTRSVIDLGASPLSQVVRQQERRLLLQALRAIPLDHQITLELYYWEGLSGPELAEVMEISPHTARSRLHRARQALELALARLADSPAQVTATLTELEGWAASVRSAG